MESIGIAARQLGMLESFRRNVEKGSATARAIETLKMLCRRCGTLELVDEVTEGRARLKCGCVRDDVPNRLRTKLRNTLAKKTSMDGLAEKVGSYSDA